jgi:hypothetical protein
MHSDISLDFLEKSKCSAALVNLHIQIFYVRSLQLLNIVSIHRSFSNCFFLCHLQVHNIPNLHIQIFYVGSLQLLNIVSIHRSFSNCFFLFHLQVHNIPKSQCEVLWSGTVAEQVITTYVACVAVTCLRVCHVTQINL